jgi:hypothetical protein
MVDVWVTKPLPSTRAVGDTVPPSNDVNLLTAALNEVQNAGLITKLDAQAIFARVNIPVKLIFSDTAPATLGPDEYWFDTSGDASVPESGYFADRASSTASTLPMQLMDSTGTITAGNVAAAYSLVKATKSYTQARMYFGDITTAPTYVAIGIYSAAGTLLGQTVSFTPTANAVNTVNLASATPISTGVGVYLGVGINGGSNVQIGKRSLLTSALSGLGANPLTRTFSGVTSSALPATWSNPTNAATVPWIELV